MIQGLEGSSRTRADVTPKSKDRDSSPRGKDKERESPRITMDAAVAMDMAAAYPNLFPYPMGGAATGMFPGKYDSQFER